MTTIQQHPGSCLIADHGAISYGPLLTSSLPRIRLRRNLLKPVRIQRFCACALRASLFPAANDRAAKSNEYRTKLSSTPAWKPLVMPASSSVQFTPVKGEADRVPALLTGALRKSHLKNQILELGG